MCQLWNVARAPQNLKEMQRAHRTVQQGVQKQQHADVLPWRQSCDLREPSARHLQAGVVGATVPGRVCEQPGWVSRRTVVTP